MTQEVLLNNSGITQKKSSLKEITEPVQENLTVFRNFFKKEISSDVFLLDQIKSVTCFGRKARKFAPHLYL